MYSYSYVKLHVYRNQKLTIVVMYVLFIWKTRIKWSKFLISHRIGEMTHYNFSYITKIYGNEGDNCTCSCDAWHLTLFNIYQGFYLVKLFEPILQYKSLMPFVQKLTNYDFVWLEGAHFTTFLCFGLRRRASDYCFFVCVGGRMPLDHFLHFWKEGLQLILVDLFGEGEQFFY